MCNIIMFINRVMSTNLYINTSTHHKICQILWLQIL